MRFTCQVSHGPSGEYTARHAGSDVGTVEAKGTTREEALRKLRDEIRYRLEFCPCSGELYQDVTIELVEP